MKRSPWLLFLSVIALPLVFAHHAEAPVLGISPLFFIQVASFVVGVVALFVFFDKKKKMMEHKQFFFLFIAVPVVLSTLYLAGFTLYENAVSETKGPVHWHADYQVWVCGERINLVDPTFPSNKIGTPLFHEHDDDRIHIEGTVKHLTDVSLGNYFSVVGGVLEEGHLRYPGYDAMYEVYDGETCKDGSVGTLKVYVNGKAIPYFSDYVIYPSSHVPPGDCIIVAFDDSESRWTNRLCESWKVQGWDYETFRRRSVTIGEYAWQ